jgi:glyoxylase-like metal-dependent hydrolase (beta-lactamase superfamily II)
MRITPLGEGLWAFPPSRDSDGGSAWLMHSAAGLAVLVDVPLLNDENLNFLRLQPPGLVVLSHRQGHGRCRRLQQALGWPVLVQEQEAYLLPTLEDRRVFADQLELEPGLSLLWTPGPSPGSCCLHWQQGQRDVLFSGRLFWPAAGGGLAVQRTAVTFHWPRLLASAKRLQAWLPPLSPAEIACAAGLGPLRGGKLVGSGRRAIELVNSEHSTTTLAKAHF